MPDVIKSFARHAELGRSFAGQFWIMRCCALCQANYNRQHHKHCDTCDSDDSMANHQGWCSFRKKLESLHQSAGLQAVLIEGPFSACLEWLELFVWCRE